MRQSLPLIDNRSILTETSGFLGGGYTHTVNGSQGCAFAKTSCGVYCYVQHSHWITKGRPWGLYGFKANVREAYRKEYDRIKKPRQAQSRPLRIFMSSSCDPYQPQELRLRQTLGLLEEMLDRPPDTLVIQTRSLLVLRDLDLIACLAQLCELWLSMTVETDYDRLPGFANHASPPGKRIESLRRFRERGVPAQATVSPLLPLADPEAFANQLDQACDRVILDHYLLGDGSADGSRTKRTALPRLLEDAGFGEWNTLEKFWEIKALFDRVLGSERVLVSAAGFNTVGQGKEDNER